MVEAPVKVTRLEVSDPGAGGEVGEGGGPAQVGGPGEEAVRHPLVDVPGEEERNYCVVTLNKEESLYSVSIRNNFFPV